MNQLGCILDYNELRHTYHTNGRMLSQLGCLCNVNGILHVLLNGLNIFYSEEKD